MSHSFHNKLQDNAESGETFINKAVFDCCFLYKNGYYKYKRIPVFYHLPFAFTHLVWEVIENDLNRIMDLLINLWDSFQIYFLNFINVLAMVLLWRQLIRLMKQRVKKSDSKMCYIL